MLSTTKKPRDLKVETVKSLTEKINSAKVLAFCNYHGLTVNQLTALRVKIKEAGGELIVAKNTLLARALKISNFLFDSKLAQSEQF